MRVLVVTLAGKPGLCIPELQQDELLFQSGIVAGFWAKFWVDRHRETSHKEATVRLAGGHGICIRESGGLLYACVGKGCEELLSALCNALQALVLASVSQKLSSVLSSNPGTDVSRYVRLDWVRYNLESRQLVSTGLGYVPVDPYLFVDPSSLKDSLLKDGPHVISHAVILGPSGTFIASVYPEGHPLSKDDYLVLSSLAATSSSLERIYLPSYGGSGCFYSMVFPLENVNLIIMSPRKSYADTFHGRVLALKRRISLAHIPLKPACIEECGYLILVDHESKCVAEFKSEDRDNVDTKLACLNSGADALSVRLGNSVFVAKQKLDNLNCEFLASFCNCESEERAQRTIDEVLLPWAEAAICSLRRHTRSRELPGPGLLRYIQSLG
ncbi:hypothetical protein NDN08_001302 [Rhodosorus marinus]|uniref:Uncharacterized protein n=1 Tax=Rhodosorus marinus TaxID=101924 RepID=A0AAV8UU39_9RHOD|nr:hypothetical protein NDN08_001302 [Rhodosorus marinus]